MVPHHCSPRIKKGVEFEVLISCGYGWLTMFHILLGYNTLKSVEIQSTFRSSLSIPSARCLLHAGFLLGLLFNPEDEIDMFLRNVG
jgi:hypothetical protein